MSQVTIETYDPLKVTVLIDGGAITGFASDGIITLARNEDTTSLAVGVQGDGVYNENANKSGTATLTLMGSSASLRRVRDLCERRREFSLSISDANNADSIHVNAERCRVGKLPDIARGKESATVSVTIIIPVLEAR